MTAQTETLLILHKNEDEIQSILENLIKHGWPNDRKHVPKELKPYWPYRDELINANGLIFKGTAASIPEKAIPKIVEKLHRSHMGLEKMLLLAKVVLSIGQTYGKT